MPCITNKINIKNVDIYYNDYGKGQPIILIHGWPLSSKSWEAQIPVLVEAGYRVISYDRRGFGKSSGPWSEYDYDTLATDLDELMSQLKLNNVVIIGFSMGGGEVVRYITKYGSKKIDKVALISSIIPLVKQKEDNPNGVPQKGLDQILSALKTNRLAFLKDFHKNFYNYTEKEQTVSQAQLDYDWSIAAHALPNATLCAAEAWANTDFRAELKNIDVKTLIIHGDADNIVPIKTSGEQAAKGIANNEYHIIKGGSHGLNITHADEVNKILLQFLKS